MAKPKIFVSMGTPYCDKYFEFRDRLETILRDLCDADPRIIGKNEYPQGNPLTKIKEVMSDCDGVIVVAYERKYVIDGTERRNSPKETKISGLSYTTPWNHIESAMAFALGIPMYIICETGVHEEGLIETKIDWYVQHIDFTPENLQSVEFTKSIQGWVAGAHSKRKKRSSYIKTISGEVPLSEIAPKDFLKVGGSLITAFTLGGLTMKYLSHLLN